ncbi:MAG: bile acid:sodium symporter family protein [Gemmataceae bacterium]
MLERFLIVWLCLLALLAYVWPEVLPAGSFDPFVASKPYLGGMIALIMFAVGSLLPHDEVAQLRRRWPSVLFGTAVQYTTMPLLAYTFAHVFVQDEALRAGIIIVGCVPGAMASNVLTLLARGNVSYSISLTTLATMLSPLVVPATLYLTLSKDTPTDPAGEFQTLMLTVVVPVLAGYWGCRLLMPLERFMHHWGAAIAHLSILWVIAVVVGLTRQYIVRPAPEVLVALLFINALGYLAGYSAGMAIRMPEAMRRALTIEIGMQNAGLGTFLALKLVPDPTVAIPPALYTFGCMLTGTMLARWWSKRPPQTTETQD